MWGIFPFLTLKTGFSSSISPLNWTRKLKFGMPFPQCYADDTLLLIAADCSDQLRARIQTTITAIILFLNKRQLQLNLQKIDIIAVDKRTKNQKPQDELTTFIINGVEINRSTTLRYHRVILDDSLSWDAHIKYIVGKCQKYIPALTAICHNTFGYSNTTRQIMYVGTIGSLLSALHYIQPKNHL